MKRWRIYGGTSGDVALAGERVVPADAGEALEIRVIAVEDGLFLPDECGDLGVGGEIAGSAGFFQQGEHLRDMVGGRFDDTHLRVRQPGLDARGRFRDGQRMMENPGMGAEPDESKHHH